MPCSKNKLYDAQVSRKTKPKLKSSKSTASIISYKDPRDPTLNYVPNPPVQTQIKLFAKRKEDFLKDMKKCEQIYASHRNAEQRLNHRENCNLRVGYK